MANLIEAAAKAVLPQIFGDKEAVILRIGTAFFDSFESISISRDINTICATFDISFADKWRYAEEDWPLVPGAIVGVNIGANPIINGFIDKLSARAANNERNITIQGRDRTCDLVDSSATVSLQTEFKNASLKDIVENFAALFGIVVSVGQGVDIGAKFEKFTLKQGESCFEAIERAAKLRGLLVISDELGNVLITNRAGGTVDLPSNKNLISNFDFTSVIKTLSQSSVALTQGENILVAESSFDEKERFQSYIVKGQNRGTDQFSGLSVAQVQAIAVDQGVERFRATTIIAEGPIDLAAAQQRAAWEATVRAAKAIQLNITVQGWLRPDGALWKINELVNVDARFVGVNSIMLITGVSFSKSKESGTLTRLTLTRADAFAPKPTIAKGTNVPGWDAQIKSGQIKAIKALTK